jgi:hypothetical protein
MICIALTVGPQAWAAPPVQSAGTEVQVDLAGKVPYSYHWKQPVESGGSTGRFP